MLPENFNANINECIKDVANIGETIYQNICTGQITAVPWGTRDWFNAFVMPPLFLLVLALVTWFSFRVLGGPRRD
jgi:hypothetical protein